MCVTEVPPTSAPRPRDCPSPKSIEADRIGFVPFVTVTVKLVTVFVSGAAGELNRTIVGASSTVTATLPVTPVEPDVAGITVASTVAARLVVSVVVAGLVVRYSLMAMGIF